MPAAEASLAGKLGQGWPDLRPVDQATNRRHEFDGVLRRGLSARQATPAGAKTRCFGTVCRIKKAYVGWFRQARVAGRAAVNTRGLDGVEQLSIGTGVAIAHACPARVVSGFAAFGCWRFHVANLAVSRMRHSQIVAVEFTPACRAVFPSRFPCARAGVCRVDRHGRRPGCRAYWRPWLCRELHR